MADSRSDEALMALLRQGEHAALSELVSRYQQDIFRFCVHYVRDPERAEDLTQETFLRVFTARGRFQTDRRFRPWVLRIARNLCLNEIKRKKAALMESLEEYASVARDETGAVLKSAPDTPDEQAAEKERRAFLAQALDALDDESRELVTLRFFQRMPARQIGELVGSSEGAVRTRLHRILKSMNRKYQRYRDDL